MKNEQFIERLFCLEYNRLFVYAEACLVDQDFADVVVQDTFYEAVKNSDALLEHPNPAEWLVRTLRNKIRSCGRSMNRYLRRFLSRETACGLPDREDAPENRINAASVFFIMEKELRPDDFYLLRRIALDRVSLRTVSRELGISVGACRNRLERIRKKLRKYF